MTGGPMRDDAVLFRAAYRGNPVFIGHATDAELDVIAAVVDAANARDVLHAWSLVAGRDPDGRGIQVHALGWRVALVNTWITSALVGVGLQPQVVSTWSGHAYRLGTEDLPEQYPELRAHLAYALRAWGFSNVGL